MSQSNNNKSGSRPVSSSDTRKKRDDRLVRDPLTGLRVIPGVKPDRIRTDRKPSR